MGKLQFICYLHDRKYALGRYGWFQVVFDVSDNYIKIDTICKSIPDKNGYKHIDWCSEYVTVAMFRTGMVRSEYIGSPGTGGIFSVNGIYAHFDLIKKWASDYINLTEEELIRKVFRRQIRKKLISDTELKILINFEVESRFDTIQFNNQLIAFHSRDEHALYQERRLTIERSMMTTAQLARERDDI